MGRPRELTPEERADLISRGYRPVEIWVPDVNAEALQNQLKEEARRIAEADVQNNVVDWVEAAGPTDWDKP